MPRLVVILLPVIGSILWLIAGRPQSVDPQDLPYKENTPASRYPEYSRPGRFTAGNPDDDEEFLRQVRERAEKLRQAFTGTSNTARRTPADTRTHHRRSRAG